MDIRNLDYIDLPCKTARVYGGRAYTYAATSAEDDLAMADAGAVAFGDDTLAKGNTYTKASKVSKSTKYSSKTISNSKALAEAFAFSRSAGKTYSSRSKSSSDYDSRDYSVYA